MSQREAGASTSVASSTSGKEKKVPSPPKQSKAGSNWKQLRKTLDREGHRHKGRKIIRSNAKQSSQTPLNGESATLEDDQAQRLQRLLASRTSFESGKGRVSSDDLKSLPWFAEELSPEDLRLVQNVSRKSMLSEEEGGKKRASTAGTGSGAAEEKFKSTQQSATPVVLPTKKTEAGQYVAIDCEMVGVGPKGSQSVLARVSIVNWHGAVLLDTFVRPQEKVTDYRTWVSGVRASDVRNAPTFQTVQAQVADLIKGRNLVGHAIQNDLHALLLSHPRHLIRDTASYEGSRKLANTKYPSLRALVSLRLGIDIQKSGSEHSSVEDARATMALYRSLHEEWQKELSVLGRAGSARRAGKGASKTAKDTPRTEIIGQGWKKNSKRGSSGAQQGSEGSAKNQIERPVNAAHPSHKKRRVQDDPEWWTKM